MIILLRKIPFKVYYEQIIHVQVWFQNSRARDRRESKIPPLVPLANPASQTIYEQPLDLSKKEALTESVRKDNNTVCVKFTSSSPVEQKNDNASSHNQDADDLEDSPLVIDEETTDSVETKRTVPTGEIVSKVIIKMMNKNLYTDKTKDNNKRKR